MPKVHISLGIVSLFDTLTQIRLMKIPTGKATHLFEASKSLLHNVLANLSELMARLEETEELPDTKETSWWQSGHWLFG